MKKIIHLSSAHKATDIRIFNKECIALKRAGYSITLIARSEGDATTEGIMIRGISTGPSNRFIRMTHITLKVLRLGILEHGDIYHFHDPELIPAGIALKLMGKQVVYDVHEQVPKQILSKEWIPRFFRPLVANVITRIEAHSAALFDGIVAATPGIAAAFPSNKTVVVHNYPETGEFEVDDLAKYRERDRKLIYIGSISRVRGILEMIDAIAVVDHARLVLGGTFQNKAISGMARSRPGWENVDELGWLKRSEVVNIMKSCRIGLLLLHPEPNYLDSYPVKLFEYMLAGLPVITSSFPFWKQFVSDLGCGLMVDPLDTRAIADAIQWLLDNPEDAEAMGRRGRTAVLANYTWEREAKKLIDFYRLQLCGNAN